MRITQYDGMANYQAVNNKKAFKADISDSLRTKLLGSLKKGARERYSSRLTRRLERIPADVTVQNIIKGTKKRPALVELLYNGKTEYFEVTGNGNKLDIMEGILRKKKKGTSQLSEAAHTLFGI